MSTTQQSLEVAQQQSLPREADALYQKISGGDLTADALIDLMVMEDSRAWRLQLATLLRMKIALDEYKSTVAIVRGLPS